MRAFAAFLSSFILDSVCWEVVGVVKLWNEWCRTSSTTNVLPTDSFCLFYRLISDPTVSDSSINSSVLWLSEEESLHPPPKQGTAGSWNNLINHLKGWCSLKLCAALVCEAQHKDVTAWWLHCICEQKILVGIELKKPKITDQVVVCSHIILTGVYELLLCSLNHLLTRPFTFFKVLLCQCSCYVAEDQQFQWLEKVRLAGK